MVYLVLQVHLALSLLSVFPCWTISTHLFCHCTCLLSFPHPATVPLSSDLLPNDFCPLDPGFTNTNTLLIHLHIDPNNPANHASNLAPELEENEFIEILSIPVKDLWTECRKLEAEGYVIDARVGGLAEGVRLAATLGLGK